MRNNLLMAAMAILLSGCAGGYTNQANTSLKSAADKEMAAWNNVQRLYNESCPQSTPDKPLPKEKAMEMVDCYDKLARTYVLPVAFDPISTQELLTTYRKIGLKRKKGILDRDEASISTQEAWNSYLSNITAKAQAIQATAFQQDQAIAQQKRQYFQNLSQQLQAQEAQSKPTNTNTNCHVWGDTMNCTTW